MERWSLTQLQQGNTIDRILVEKEDSMLVRYQQCGCFYFPTFSCYHRQALLTREGAYSVFE
jgi:hypothetical protein